MGDMEWAARAGLCSPSKLAGKERELPPTSSLMGEPEVWGQQGCSYFTHPHLCSHHLSR